MFSRSAFRGYDQGLARASFHLVMHGGCWLHIEGEAAGIRLESGDAAFILRDLDYRLSSAPAAEQARGLPRQIMQPLAEQAVEDTGLVCGFFRFHSGLSGLTVEQSASAVGYQSVAAFTRSFAKTTGVQPGAYRKLHEVRVSG